MRVVSTTTLTLLVAAAALMLGAGQVAAYPYAVEQPLATGTSTQDAPSCGTSIAVWEDDAAGDWNVTAGWQPLWAVIAAGVSDQRNPAADGNLVVFEDDRGGDWDIYGWVASSPTDPLGERTIAAGAGNQLDPAVSGDTVVYEDYGRGNADIGLYDMGTGAARLLSTDPSAQVDPAVDGSWVVWADRRSGDWDIYAYDLQRSLLKRLTTSTADQTAPQIAGNKVVYQDRRNGDWDIYEYDLATGKERRLTTGSSNQTAPQIDIDPAGFRQGTVVYVDDRSDAGDLYVRDDGTGISKPLCTEPGAQTSPSITGDDVVWTDSRDGQADIYGGHLSFPVLSVPMETLTCAWSGAVTVSGYLYTYDPFGQQILVAGSGKTRSATTANVGAGGGRYALDFKQVTRRLNLRVWYPGDAAHLPTWGGTVVVKPRVVLSTPRLARTPGNAVNGAKIPAHPNRCTIAGTIRPRHPAGSRAVTLQIYRRNRSTDWRLYKTLAVAVTNAGRASAYRLRLDLSKSYSWRVQAVHDDRQHARTVSAFSRTL